MQRHSLEPDFADYQPAGRPPVPADSVAPILVCLDGHSFGFTAEWFSSFHFGSTRCSCRSPDTGLMAASSRRDIVFRVVTGSAFPAIVLSREIGRAKRASNGRSIQVNLCVNPLK